MARRGNGVNGQVKGVAACHSRGAPRTRTTSSRRRSYTASRWRASKRGAPAFASGFRNGKPTRRRAGAIWEAPSRASPASVAAYADHAEGVTGDIAPGRLAVTKVVSPANRVEGFCSGQGEARASAPPGPRDLLHRQFGDDASDGGIGLFAAPVHEAAGACAAMIAARSAARPTERAFMPASRPRGATSCAGRSSGPKPARS